MQNLAMALRDLTSGAVLGDAGSLSPAVDADASANERRAVARDFFMLIDFRSNRFPMFSLAIPAISAS